MREITVRLYQFDELSDTAKEKAREWFRGDDGLITQDTTDYIVEDAERIGLTLISLDGHRKNEGKFLASAEETAHKIESEHGNSCETYKTAKAYLKARDELIDQWEKDENGEFVNQDKLDISFDALDSNFLYDLLEDYRIMLNQKIEYQYSDESVDENIRANEYEFTEKGERA